jgi:hypothetical protein
LLHLALQIKSALDSLDKQVSLSQAEARSLARQLRETSQQLSLLQEDHAATEGVLARMKDERQQLLAVSCAASTSGWLRIVLLDELSCRIASAGPLQCEHMACMVRQHRSWHTSHLRHVRHIVALVLQA